MVASWMTAMLMMTGTPSFGQDLTTEGMESFAAEGGVMEANPSCFMNECGDASRACFTNPSCLKGVTCLGRCRGEQTCATRCFARFGSEKLNSWLSCTLEEHKCVATGVEQDVSAYFKDAPTRMSTFDPRTLEGDWWKVVGYSAKYDCFACQKTKFGRYDSSKKTVSSDIDFRVEKLDGAGFWQNSLGETLVDDRGPQGKASFLVNGKMYGLTFDEQWYVLDADTQKGGTPYVFVAYKGSTQQGPYDGAFVFTKDKDAWARSSNLRDAVAKVAKANGFDPDNFCLIDNACPSGDQISAFGASADESNREQLSWRDLLELTEWFRPGTLAKDADFDPASMR